MCSNSKAWLYSEWAILDFLAEMNSYVKLTSDSESLAVRGVVLPGKQVFGHDWFPRVGQKLVFQTGVGGRL